jgi:hypothetical protein
MTFSYATPRHAHGILQKEGLGVECEVIHTSCCLPELMAAHHHHPGFLLSALTTLDCNHKTGQRPDCQNDQKTKECIGRESNPGLADI